MNYDHNAKAIEAASRVVAAQVESGRYPIGADPKELTVTMAQRFLRFITTGQ